MSKASEQMAREFVGNHKSFIAPSYNLHPLTVDLTALLDKAREEEQICRLAEMHRAEAAEGKLALWERALPNTAEHVAEVAALKAERDEAKDYAADIAAGICHYPHEANEPCCRCQAETLKAENERLRRALDEIERRVGHEYSPLHGKTVFQVVQEERAKVDKAQSEVKP